MRNICGKILTENPGLFERYFLSTFVSGLKEELRPMVRMHGPLTLTYAFELALW